MTDKELVERLNAYSAQYQNHGGITAEAADRIEQLRAELTNERIANTNLIGELATVAAERDRYKAERENPQPLTLEELRRMDGEVVYIPESEEYFGGMGIVSVSQEIFHCQSMYIFPCKSSYHLRPSTGSKRFWSSQ
jgi:hypothetical protein